MVFPIEVFSGILRQVTFTSLARSQKKRKQPVKKNPFWLFEGKPLKSGTCTSPVVYLAPRKPNSAKRRYVKVRWYQKRGFLLSSKKVVVHAYVSGQIPKKDVSEYTPKNSADLLIRCQGGKDLPGIKTTVVRGHAKSLKGLSWEWRRTARSKYGTKRIWSDLELKEKYKNSVHYRAFKYH